MELETDDLAALPDLNEESLLVYLKARYKHDIIYVSTNTIKYQNFDLIIFLPIKTYIGDILLAINPFKEIPFYDQKVRIS